MFISKLFPGLSYKPLDKPYSTIFKWNDEPKTEGAQSQENLKAVARQLGHYYNPRDYIRVYDSTEKATELITGQRYVYVSYHGVR